MILLSVEVVVDVEVNLWVDEEVIMVDEVAEECLMRMITVITLMKKNWIILIVEEVELEEVIVEVVVELLVVDQEEEENTMVVVVVVGEVEEVALQQFLEVTRIKIFLFSIDDRLLFLVLLFRYILVR
jgi:hypothetical protein